MADLLDIAPSTSVEAVKLGDRFVTVHGLHADAIALILSRFPHLSSLLAGIDAGPQLIAQFGSAIGPIIAAGCGHLGEEKYEQHAAKLMIEDQLKLIKAIIGLTFPKGVTSFVTALTAFLAGTDERAKPVRIRLKKSPLPSQLSS